jgi:hypothetical protein
MKAMVFNEYPHHTALTLRLTRPYHESNRLIIVDASFVSVMVMVRTAIGLLRHGLYFVGPVNTCHSSFVEEEE